MRKSEMENKENMISPAFSQNNIAIGMSSSNEYVPYLLACLQSLVDNSSADYNYDIIIFEQSISDRNKLILKSSIEQKNISLRFINPISALQNYSFNYPKRYALECYFRLVAPVVLKEYEKVIFTDVDLIFQADIKDLFLIDVSESPLAACQDLMMGAFLNYDEGNWFEYCKQTLMLENPYNYFNTGVMVLNIKEFNEKGYVKELLSIADGSSFRILEQDILNKFFQNKIKYIDEAWNFPVANKEYKNMLPSMPQSLKEKYNSIKKSPKIIHWAGKLKPWHYPDEEMAEIWWSYTQKTPFYEFCFKKMVDFLLEGQNCILKDVLDYKKNCLSYWRYKFFSAVSFGEKRQFYKQKRNSMKQKIKNAKNILKRDLSTASKST